MAMADHTPLTKSQNFLASHPSPSPFDTWLKQAETAQTPPATCYQAHSPHAFRILDQENKDPKTPEGDDRVRRWIHNLPAATSPPAPSPSLAASVSHLYPPRKRPRPLTATQPPNTQRPSRKPKDRKQPEGINQQGKKRGPQAHCKKPRKMESTRTDPQRRSGRIAAQALQHLPGPDEDTGPSRPKSPTQPSQQSRGSARNPVQPFALNPQNPATLGDAENIVKHPSADPTSPNHMPPAGSLSTIPHYSLHPQYASKEALADIKAQVTREVVQSI